MTENQLKLPLENLNQPPCATPVEELDSTLVQENCQCAPDVRVQEKVSPHRVWYEFGEEQTYESSK